MSVLDKRMNAYRDDLADRRLEGRVTATRFVEGRPVRVTVPLADLLRAPRADAGLDSQMMLGDMVSVFEEADGFAWVQAQADGYVGYVAADALAAITAAPTHIVAVPRTFLYAEPDMKLPRRAALSMGSRLEVIGTETTRGTDYALIEGGGAVVASHLRARDDLFADYVSVAETLIHTPYLWGGASAFGIDCSGLVQLSMRMAGMAAGRDSDMQASGLGVALDPQASALRRGDLVFWKGHVAIMIDEATIIHANGHTMTVAIEPLAEAVARIGYLYGQPTGWRRP